MRPSKEFKPGPSLAGTEGPPPRRDFRKGRFMDTPETVPTEVAAGPDAETFLVDLTQQPAPADTPAASTVGARSIGGPVSKYEARSLSSTVKRGVDVPQPVADEPPERIEIDLAEPAPEPRPAKEWTSEASLEGDRYWRKDSRR